MLRSLAIHMLDLADVVQEAQFSASKPTELNVQKDSLSISLLTQLLVTWASDRVKDRVWEVQLKTSLDGQAKQGKKTTNPELFMPSFVECEGVEVNLKLGDEHITSQQPHGFHSFVEGDLFTLEPMLRGGALLNKRTAQAAYERMQRQQRSGYQPEPVAVGVVMQLNPEVKAVVAPAQMTGSISKMLRGLEIDQVKWLLRPIPSLATMELCWKAVTGQKPESKEGGKDLGKGKKEDQSNDILEALHASFASDSLHSLLSKLARTENFPVKH